MARTSLLDSCIPSRHEPDDGEKEGPRRMNPVLHTVETAMNEDGVRECLAARHGRNPRWGK
jgi:hypothetical protein